MKTKRRMDARKILEKLSLDEDREKISLYLSRNLYGKFKKACGKAPASRVMEELMKDFVEEVDELKI